MFAAIGFSDSGVPTAPVVLAVRLVVGTGPLAYWIGRRRFLLVLPSLVFGSLVFGSLTGRL
jgi:hypothetical protein